MGKKVFIVGAGIAGLSSAIRLQHAGYEVEIFEQGATLQRRYEDLSGRLQDAPLHAKDLPKKGLQFISNNTVNLLSFHWWPSLGIFSL